MLPDPGLIADDERDLLAQAAAYPEQRCWSELTRTSLAQVAAKRGLDFATALLYERLCRSEQHGPFIQRINEFLSADGLGGEGEAPAEPLASARQEPRPPLPTPRSKVEGKLDILLAVAPGAFHKELPGTGADGSLLRQRVGAYGCRTTVIPTHSMGSALENGRLICEWLAEHAHEKILLASISKGGADVKCALARPEAEAAFRPVVAWLNLSGMLEGTPVATRLLKPSLTALCFRALMWWKGLDFAINRHLQWGPGSALDFPLALPAHVRMITLVGFPLQRHFTSGVLRSFHRRMGALGPNDGLVLLADACALPGLVYPVWAADHNLRPAWDIRRLVAALTCYLGETLNLWARPAKESPCPSRC